MSKDPGLGLSNSNLSSLRTDVDRPHVEYTLPENKISRFFQQQGFEKEDLTFRMIEISPAQQDRAAKTANNNPSVLSRELLFASLWQVGSWSGRDNRDKLAKWWEAIGTKGRRYVEAAFMEMQSVEEADVESFLASGRAKS
jgi:hypothetical protein